MPTSATTTWEELRDGAKSTSLTAAGQAAVNWAFDYLEEKLGSEWPEVQERQAGGVPAMFRWHSTHAWMLPQLLSFATCLHRFAEADGVDRLLAILRGGVPTHGFRHAVLQLEVARAATCWAATAAFEPDIPGSVNSSDVHLHQPDGQSTFVETFTLALSDADRADQERDRQIGWQLQSIAWAHGVDLTVTLNDCPDPDTLDDWLAEIERAASSLSTVGGRRSIGGPVGSCTISKTGPTPGTLNLDGAIHRGAGWKRMNARLKKKGFQGRGGQPTWLRVDSADGLFGLSNWSALPLHDRLEQIIPLICAPVRDLDHVHGVIMSSGPAQALGMSDPLEVNAVAHVDGASMLRVLIAAHLGRETVIVPLCRQAEADAARWREAYLAEASWLAEDAFALALGTPTEWWRRSDKD